MTKVYDAQQQWAIANKTFTAGLPDSELLEVEEGKRCPSRPRDSSHANAPTTRNVGVS
jgi:hypothetical protein